MAPLIKNEIDMIVMDLDDLDYQQHDTIKPLHQQEASNSAYTTTKNCSSRGVTFADDVRVYDVLHRYDYTVEEISQTWYNRYDLRSQKDNARSEGKLIERGLLFECHDVTVRGLESKTTEGTRRKRQNRMHAYSAVFLEVETQQDLGIVDEDAIADAYYNYSEQCQFQAQMIALRDAEEAEKLCYDTTNNIQTSATVTADHFGANILKTIL
jgi:hypothetical protein